MIRKKNKTILLGYLFAFLSYFLWGILPIYWKLIKTVPVFELLAHRIFWSFIFLSLIMFFQKRQDVFNIFKNKKLLKGLFLASLLIGTNWFVFIFAVNSNRILEASLGYYINPLISVLLAVFVLKERLTLLQLVALIFAFSGVLYLTINFGKLPIISLILAFSFALYGLTKKKLNIESLPALTIETLVLAPLTFGYIIFLFISQNNTFLNNSFRIDSLLIFSGVVTALPLYLFGKGVQRIPLKSVGFLQYIAPTFMLIIGTLIYHETFSRVHLISFIFIWIALILYTISLFKK